MTIAFQINPAPNVGIVRDSYGVEQRVEVRRQRSRNANHWTIYAPGWRVLKFSDPSRAASKLESHPDFVRWEV